MDAEMEMCLIFVMVHEKMLNVLVSFGNHRAHSVLNMRNDLFPFLNVLAS